MATTTPGGPYAPDQQAGADWGLRKYLTYLTSGDTTTIAGTRTGWQNYSTQLIGSNGVVTQVSSAVGGAYQPSVRNNFSQWSGAGADAYNQHAQRVISYGNAVGTTMGNAQGRSLGAALTLAHNALDAAQKSVAGLHPATWAEAYDQTLATLRVGLTDEWNTYAPPQWRTQDTSVVATYLLARIDTVQQVGDPDLWTTNQFITRQGQLNNAFNACFTWIWATARDINQGRAQTAANALNTVAAGYTNAYKALPAIPTTTPGAQTTNPNLPGGPGNPNLPGPRLPGSQNPNLPGQTLPGQNQPGQNQPGGPTALPGSGPTALPGGGTQPAAFTPAGLPGSQAGGTQPAAFTPTGLPGGQFAGTQPATFTPAALPGGPGTFGTGPFTPALDAATAPAGLGLPFGTGPLGASQFGAGPLGPGLPMAPGGFGAGGGGRGFGAAGLPGSGADGLGGGLVGPDGVIGGGVPGEAMGLAGPAAEAAELGAAGAAGRGGMPMMPMMPPGGGRDSGKNRSRTAYLPEDDDIWGTGIAVAPPVIGV